MLRGVRAIKVKLRRSFHSIVRTALFDAEYAGLKRPACLAVTGAYLIISIVFVRLNIPTCPTCRFDYAGTNRQVVL